MNEKKWQFWIDRGGTFTDIVAQPPSGPLISAKFLSEDPKRYDDAAIAGIRHIMGAAHDAPFPSQDAEIIRMGTTVATNALLEHQGAKTALVITEGFEDALAIGTQHRPKLFALHIEKPTLIYSQVISVKERIKADGSITQPLDLEHTRAVLEQALEDGIQSLAICLVHGYVHTTHEKAIADIARELNFREVSVSHEIAPLIKLVPRAQTALINAYLNPVLKHYVSQVSREINDTSLYFMQSSGGLAHKDHFLAKDAILSGPAGGVIGAVETAKRSGFNKIIAFDMGGTSTDVSHFAGEIEYSTSASIAGQQLYTPMLDIHTIAAGGGSRLGFDGIRLRVGPESAGSDPGPTSYGKGGPLAVTDCHAILGRLPVDHFPKVLGKDGRSPLDIKAAKKAMLELRDQIEAESGRSYELEALAEGYLDIATQHMARAIKSITIERGQDIDEHILVAFGGAGGQLACRVADALSLKTIMIHPMAGVLSALGIGLSHIALVKEKTVQFELTPNSCSNIEREIKALTLDADAALKEQVTGGTEIVHQPMAYLRYRGSDTSLPLPWTPKIDDLIVAFEDEHESRYGFRESHGVVELERLAIHSKAISDAIDLNLKRSSSSTHKPLNHVGMFVSGNWTKTPVYRRDDLSPDKATSGPAILLDPTSTTCVEPGWEARIDIQGALILSKTQGLKKAIVRTTKTDPIKLEIFNNLFMSIAEQMGRVLEHTAHSVNIKERLDFSCALFDQSGDLVANAPHMPVHLGSMSECVKALIHDVDIMPGSAYAINDPYHGGTHLPDITVVTPVFLEDSGKPRFFVASRGHHADVGGITPGSMPARSTSIEEEGALFRAFPIVIKGEFQEQATRDILNKPPYPARNPDQNIADLKAQIAANTKGVQEIHKMIRHFGRDMVDAYMDYIQDAAEAAVRRAISKLKNGHWVYPLDIGAEIHVRITVDPTAGEAEIDFTGTSAQGNHNFHAPLAITRAAVLYAFRCLVDDEIPLNAGCLKPIRLIVPKGSLLNPIPPAAVVAGNVETSQAVTNALFLAMGVMAASQGTMNNLSFGNAQYQYYETLAGGTGAGPGFDGADAVHSHMTNSRLTDVEVIESRLPVEITRFCIRPNSGGAGEYRGGNGLIRHIRFDQEMTATLLSNHRLSGPPGLKGGEAGKPGQGSVKRRDGHIEPIGATAEINLKPGDELRIETPGGGGFGAKNG
ncbi:MAG: hydantoinase B/oxoprolinase family protein [Sphingomonadales bacterium]|jgi:5-oxoprolinase (ATP-hydrolysing)